MRKMVIVLGLVAVVVLGITYVYAQNPGYGRMGWSYGKWSSLAPEQETKLQDLRQKFNDETTQLRGTIITKRLELQSLWTNPKADPKAILDKEKELRTLQNELKDKTVQLRLEARKLLTPEQIANWKSGRGMGRGHMMGHGAKKGSGPRMGHGYGMGPGYGSCR